MAKVLQKPAVFALPGRQQISVDTLLCDTLGLAEEELQNCHFPCIRGTKKRKFARVEHRGSRISLPWALRDYGPISDREQPSQHNCPKVEKGGERQRFFGGSGAEALK